MLATAQSLSSSNTEALVVSRSATGSRAGSGRRGAPWKAFVPDRLTVLTEMPAERLKSVASAPPLTTATCSMSCDDGSAESVPKSGRFTFTPSKA